MEKSELESEVKEILKELKLTNEYTPKQTAIIIAGYTKGLNYKLLLNQNLSSGQMYEILSGLELRCPVSKYADEKFSKEQIRTLNYILSHSHNISKVNKLINSELNIDVMMVLYRAMLLNINVDKYITNKYNSEQLQVIINGIIEGLNVSLYDNYNYDSNKMNLLYLMLQYDFYEKNVDYDKFNAGQLMEIYTGYIARVNVHLYMNPKFSVLQMRQLRIGQLNGLETSSYSDPSLRYDEMKLKRLELEKIRDDNVISEITSFLNVLE